MSQLQVDDSPSQPIHKQPKQSTQSAPTNSSINTIFALLNSMMGGTMLALPLLFRQTGMLSSLVILLVSGFISSKTCNIFLIHLAPKDKDVQDSIKRIMRGRWYEFFCLITGVYLIMLNVLYVVLINDQLYNIIAYGMEKAGTASRLAPKQEFSFSKMSGQWLAIISFLPLLGVLFVKNLNLILKFTSIGVYSVLVYFIFIAYVFLDNLKNIDGPKVKLFSWDIGNLAGTCALAFTIHTVVAPISKMNKNQKSNSRNLYICYALGSVIYAFLGICGQLAIQNRSGCTDKAQTIIDCFPNGSWQPLVVAIMYLLSLVTVFPCFMDVSRKRLFSAFSQKPITDRQRLIFNLGFMGVSLAFGILAPFVKLSDIMNFTGAIFCFFFVYLIPVALHYRCLENNKLINEDPVKVFFRKGESLIQSKESLITTTEPAVANPNSQCAHLKEPQRKVNKYVRWIFYGTILLIGLVTMVYGLYNSVLIFV